MNDLITRLERAEGPIRSLLLEAAKAVWGWDYTQPGVHHDVWVERWNRFHRMLDAEAWTDAALTLVPEGALWSAEAWDTNGVYPAHVRASAWVHGAQRCYAATPALALCIAALRAHQKDTNA